MRNGVMIGVSTHLTLGPSRRSNVFQGAAAAYSTRIPAGSTYSGPLIRVRRSSDNAEANFGVAPQPDANGNRWLDTTSLLSFCSGGSGFVTTWYDQNENGRNAVQTTAGAQPLIVSAGVIATIGTAPALTMNGTAWMSMASAYLALRNDITMVAPFQTADTTNYNYWFFSPSFLGAEMPGVVNDFAFGYNSGKLMIGDTGSQYSGSLYVTGSAKIATFSRQSSNGALLAYLNGVVEITATGSTGTRVNNGLSFGSPNAAGGSNCLKGSYPEMVVFQNVLTTTQRQTLERSQGAAFGITVA